MNFLYDDPEEGDLSRWEASKAAGAGHAKSGARLGAIGGGLSGAILAAMGQGEIPEEGGALAKYLLKTALGGVGGAGLGGLVGGATGGAEGLLEGALTPQYYKNPRRR